MIEEMPTIVYNLCDLILNGISDDVLLDTPIMTPLDIKIKPSFTNMSANDEHTLIIEYTPSSFIPLGLSDMVSYESSLDDEDEVEYLIENHDMPIEASFVLREVNGKGMVLYLLDKYKEHPLVKTFCSNNNMNFLGLKGSVVSIPFEINSTYYQESVGTFRFYFMDSYEVVTDYFDKFSIKQTIDEEEETIVIDGGDIDE